ncbi:MAG: adenosylcobinamide-phosphate synthase CbiB [Lachnospiraceae bacterium]|nr:adenosylcobinamide-phosphate synthase CbiB [Lachnospiraceae bacterium]MCM1279473.1 adenosylcobinamide-phosphate synthase CbiB [Robinsoniella sp.]
MDRAICILAGFLLDLLLGDPYWLPHPIRLIGALIGRLEKWLRKEGKGQRQMLVRGGVLVVFVLCASTAVPLMLLVAAYRIHHVLGLFLETIMCYQILAVKSLKVESMKVYAALSGKDLEGARKAVSMIVGRDTMTLDEKGIIKAAVETVAENTSDGVIAPLCFLALGGAAFGFFYKAVNTMDSMIGYKNEAYLYFGRAAAKLDDLCNYIPSRLAAMLMTAASFFLGYDWKNAARIHKRDGRNHASPNSAQTESVCAGALQVCLAGDAYYFGKKVSKPTIGEELREIEAEDIKRANGLLYSTAVLMVVLLEVIIMGVSIWLKI